MAIYINLDGDIDQDLDRYQAQSLMSENAGGMVGLPPDEYVTLVNFEGFTPRLTLLKYDPVPSATYPDAVEKDKRRVGSDGYVYQAWKVVTGTDQQYADYNTGDLENRLRQANAQVFALQGRVNNLDWLINQQDPDDEDYTEPTADEIAELPVRRAQLTKWNSYTAKLNRVKTAAGWPRTPVWPVMPEPYTTETSLVAAPTS